MGKKDQNVASMNCDSKQPIRRSYSREIVRPLKSLQDFEIHSIGEVCYGNHYYPMFGLIGPAVPVSSNPWILISGGVHGDEVAGPFSVLDFTKSFAKQYLHGANFVILPCINPSGFEADTLETMSGANLNRLFNRSTEQPEIRIIEAWVRSLNLRFRATFDLHEVAPYCAGEGFRESDNPDGAYLYETISDGSNPLGHLMINALPASLNVCQWPEIYHDINNHGVVSYPAACRNEIYAEKTSFDAYLNEHFTGQSYTTETPTFWSLESRILAQITFLQTALDNLLE